MCTVCNRSRKHTVLPLVLGAASPNCNNNDNLSFVIITLIILINSLHCSKLNYLPICYSRQKNLPLAQTKRIHHSHYHFVFTSKQQIKSDNVSVYFCCCRCCCCCYFWRWWRPEKLTDWLTDGDQLPVPQVADGGCHWYSSRGASFFNHEKHKVDVYSIFTALLAIVNIAGSGVPSQQFRCLISFRI